MKIFVSLFGALILFISAVSGQIDSTANLIAQFPNRIFAKLNHKASDLDNALAKQTEKYLRRLAKKERKIQERVYKLDSNAAKNLFSGSQKRYDSLEKVMENSGMSASSPREYLPYMDSLKTTLEFAQKNPELFNISSKEIAEINSSLAKYGTLQNNINQADKIKEYLRERKQLLKEQLKQYLDNSSLKKYLNEYNSQVYYYSEQLKEYKDVLNDPDKMERLALSILEKVPAFDEFMKSNSIMASLFPAPSNLGSQLALSGLQTRSMIQQLFQAQLSAGGSNAQNAFSNSVQEAESQLGLLRDRVLKYGSNGSDISDPAFKPNQQHTKTFLQRLEYGFNIQTTQASNYFPVTTDFGLSIGYKINSNATIGLGGSYNVGWGSGFTHIKLSTQGGSVRSFVDVKAKGSLYLTGGFEYNLQPVQALTYQQFQKTTWQRSGLIGLSKIVNIKSSLTRKTKIQLLWDFLSYSQLPPSQPFKFRVGYVW